MVGNLLATTYVNSGLPYSVVTNGNFQPYSTVAAVAGTYETFRTLHKNCTGKALKGIVLVYGNYLKSGNTEALGALVQVQIRASFQRFGSSVTDQTGERSLAKFKGVLTGVLDPGCSIESEFIPVDIGVGERFYILSAVTPTSGAVRPVSLRDVFGGTANAGRDTGEGYTNSDVTASGTVTIQERNNTFGPLAILGLTVDGTLVPSVAVFGDSITEASNDIGMGRDWGGWAERAFGGYTGVWGQTTATNSCPYLKFAYGGETAQSFNSMDNIRVRGRMAGYVTHEVHEHGTNDLGNANLQTWILNAAVRSMVQGRRVIRCTILPRATSTDGFKTAASQATAGTEGGVGGRATVNSWLRDTSASGFVAQAITAARARNPLAAGCRVLDICAPIEVNSSGVLTANGGLILPDTGSVLSGTAGVGTTVNQLVTTMTVAIDQYRGYTVRRVANNEINGIWYHPASAGSGTFQFRSSFATFTSGDAYEIYQSPIADGVNGSVHYSSPGHKIIGDYVNALMPDLVSFW